MNYPFKRGTRINFWHYQILGWTAFSVWDLFNSFDWWVSPLTIIIPKWIINIAIAFTLSLILRYFYQRVYKNIHRSSIIILICFISSFVCSLIWYYIRYFVFELIDNNAMEHGGISRLVLSIPLRFYTMIIYYSWPHFLWSILYFWIKYSQDLVAEQERVSRAEILVQKAQLQMLRYQINPHFLFNSLNSIQGLMYKDIKNADLMLTELSDFLRYTLKFNNDIYIPVKDEFEIIEKYLSVEKIRFSDKLNYKIDLPENIRNGKILCFLTQPFVENAIKHGMKSNPYEKVGVNVLALKVNNSLVIRISNNGKWRNNQDEIGTGISNIKERLNNAYPNSYSLNIVEEDNLVKVELIIPYHE